MKEFKYCHEEITEGVEIPVTVCETQKEMVGFIVNYRDDFKFAMESLDEVMKSRENGGFDYEDAFGRMKRNERAYHEAMDTALSGTDEETVYIIYKDGSTYFQNGGMGCEGKFKRTGIARAMISTAYEAFVFGDFAINDMGDVTIEESDIEEYGVYAGQYDVKEQEAQEVQETVEQTEVEETAETETEETIKTTAEQETVEGISKTETTTETDDSGFEYYSVETAEVSKEVINNRKEVNSTNFIQQLYDAEYSKTLTAHGGIERFLKLAKEFVKNKSAEMSLIVDTAAQVLHDKYKLDYGTIEALEIEAYTQ